MKDQFLKLISDNQGLIFKVCNMYCNNKEDKDDLFQDIVLQLWRAYPTFKGDSKISTWMYRIAINNAITGLRKTTRMEPFAELGDEALQVAVTENSGVLTIISLIINHLYYKAKYFKKIKILEANLSELS